MKIALIQMPVGFDKAENCAVAAKYVKKAAEAGAGLAVLPEMFCCPYSNKYFADYSEPQGGAVYTALSEMAAENNITLFGGSMPESEDGKVYNTCFIFGPSGELLGKYRKAHLFDIDVKGGQQFFESHTFTAGDDVLVLDTECGRLGICICFDLRFPELSRLMALDGAQAIIVPAAFNMTTGPAHWELLFRQRAVDNQLYTIGCAPARDENGVYVSYGNSIISDPWGTVIARAGAAEEMIIADIDFDKNTSIRQQLPLLSARRADIYTIKHS